MKKCQCGGEKFIKLEGTESRFQKPITLCVKCRRVIDLKQGEVGFTTGLPLPAIYYKTPKQGGVNDDTIGHYAIVSREQAWDLNTGKKINFQSLRHYEGIWNGYFEGFKISKFSKRKLRRRFEDFLRKASLEDLLRASDMFGQINGWTNFR